MEKKELIEKLKSINIKVSKGIDKNRLYDLENAHREADDLIIEFINDKEIKEVYDSIDKWFA